MRITIAAPEWWPWWYKEVLTKLDLIQRFDPFTYVSSSLTMDPADGGEVLALTETLVVHAQVANIDRGGSGDVAISAWSRSDLIELRVLQFDDHATFSSSASTEPDYLRIELCYGGRPAITLPLGDRAGKRATRATVQAYARLLKDLSRKAERRDAN